MPDPAPWPEWLTEEYSALHNAIVNDIVRALEHCYSSADAAGMGWTEDGLYSCAASNILGRLRAAGCPPTFGEPEQLDLDAVHREWAYTYDEDDDEETCAIDRAAAEVAKLRKQVQDLRVQLAVHHLHLTMGPGASCAECGSHDLTLDPTLRPRIAAVVQERDARRRAARGTILEAEVRWYPEAERAQDADLVTRGDGS